MSVPIYKKWWFWLIIVLVVAGVLGAVFGTGGSDTNNAGNNGNNASAGNNGSGNNNSTAKNYIGTKVKSGDLEFTVKSVSDKTKVGSTYLGAETDYNFILVTLQIKNCGSKEVSLTSSNFRLLLGSSEYEPHTAGAYVAAVFMPMKLSGQIFRKLLWWFLKRPANIPMQPTNWQ